MRHIYIRLIGLLLVVLGALTVTAPILGGTQPPDATLTGFMTGCMDRTLPCWYGIMPGSTPAAEANTILQGLGYRYLGTSGGISLYTDEVKPPGVICSVKLIPQQGIVNILDLSICQTVKVGDVLNTLGYPTAVGWGGSLSIAGGAIDLMRDHTKSTHCVDLTPNGLVRMISLQPARPPDQQDSADTRWRGFMSYERYARLYYFPFCDDPNLDSP